MGEKLQKFNAAVTTSLNIIFVLILLVVLAILALTAYIYHYIKTKVEHVLSLVDHTEKQLRRTIDFSWIPHTR